MSDFSPKMPELGLSGRLNTAFIERVNLTARHGVAALARRTWATAQQSPQLLVHLEWWRAYYHFVRPHTSLRMPLVHPRERGGKLLAASAEQERRLPPQHVPPCVCAPQPSSLKAREEEQDLPKTDRSLGHDRGTDRNRRASNHRSHLARIPLEKLFSGRGDLLVYQAHAATSSPLDDPFTSALDDPLLVSLPDHPHGVADPHWKIPPSAWATVLQRVEQREPLRHIARDYGVSYEAVRRVLRAARRR